MQPAAQTEGKQPTQIKSESTQIQAKAEAAQSEPAKAPPAAGGAAVLAKLKYVCWVQVLCV